MNATRVYNPIKQAQDHDPHGHFVRKWLPYMRQVPDSWLFEPWRMPAELQNRYGVIVDSDIPVPIVILRSQRRLLNNGCIPVENNPMSRHKNRLSLKSMARECFVAIKKIKHQKTSLLFNKCWLLIKPTPIFKRKLKLFDIEHHFTNFKAKFGDFSLVD